MRELLGGPGCLGATQPQQSIAAVCGYVIWTAFQVQGTSVPSLNRGCEQQQQQQQQAMRDSAWCMQRPNHCGCDLQAT